MTTETDKPEELMQDPALPVIPGWHEQDPVLREMWQDNKTPEEISAALGRSVAAVMTRAARLGLPRRAAPGRKRGYKLDTPRREKGVRIKVRVPRPEDEETIEEPRYEAKMRVCLMCLNKFQSQGRHNRICPSCKGSAEYMTGSSTPDYDFRAGG